MLVVVAIIGILASLLFPVLTTVRGRGEQTVCLYNLKQISFTINDYSQDSAGYAPMGYTSYDGVNSNPWARVIWKAGYISDQQYTGGKNVSFLSCSGRNAPQADRVYNNPHYNYAIRQSAYWWVPSCWLKMYSSTVISSPVAYPLGWDSYRLDGGTPHQSCYCGVSDSDKTSYSGTSQIHLRHLGMAEVFFADGHVSSVLKSQLSEIGFGDTVIYGGQ